jgi:hypothetical protein
MARPERWHSSSQTPYFLPLGACDKLCHRSCGTAKVSSQNDESVTQVRARFVTHVPDAPLTPALSPLGGERENQRQISVGLLCKSRRTPEFE